MKNWTVVNHAINREIGPVVESNEPDARCAALWKYGKEGERQRGDLSSAIFEDEDFDVRPTL